MGDPSTMGKLTIGDILKGLTPTELWSLLSALVLLLTGAFSLGAYLNCTIVPTREKECHYILGDAFSDFKSQTNDAGMWIYGYLDQSYSFMKFTENFNSGDMIGWQADDPLKIGKNSDEPITKTTDAGRYVIPAGLLYMHPSEEKPCVLRWISPIAGRVRIEGRFEGLSDERDRGTTSEAWIRLKDATIFPKRAIDGFGPRSSILFNEVADVKVGDTIDFVVGSGENGALYDSTGLDASVIFDSRDAPGFAKQVR